VTRPQISREHIHVQFEEPKPSYRENEKIVKPDIQTRKDLTVQHTLPIPVEDQRLVSIPAKVNYDVPIFRYEYVPTE
jgi:hypothetical protein